MILGSKLLAEIRSSTSRISLQLDESTDVSNFSQLLVFSRYIHEGDLKEEFLMCESLESTTKAIDVFEKLEGFFEQNQITWDNVGSLCTDGAPAMMGVKSGFTTLVKKRAPHVISTHCVLHRHALASKTLPQYLKYVLAKVVECVNYIRSRALNHLLFKKLCDELGSHYSVLLYHTEVRWLSRGLMLSRVFDLRVEMGIFLRDKGSSLSEHFEDSKFNTAMAYLSDIFALLNKVNLAMQGNTVTILEASEKLQAFQTKLELWAIRIEKKNFATFSNLDGICSPDCFVSADLIEEIAGHLRALKSSFDNYFSIGMISTGDWITTPFITKLSEVDDDDPGKDELIEMKSSAALRHRFEVETPGKFWGSLIEAYPLLSQRAFNVIVPFVTTYLCE